MKKGGLWFLVLFCALALSACAAPGAGNKATDGGCPAATEGTRLLENTGHGYCLLYPDGYNVESPNPSETVLVVGSLLNVTDPRAMIEVQPAAGRTAQQVADDLAGAIPGFDVRRSVVTLGGEEAIVLENVPGQDIGKVVLIVHGERLYRLTFVPASEDAGPVFERTEALYAAVTESWRFQ